MGRDTLQVALIVAHTGWRDGNCGSISMFHSACRPAIARKLQNESVTVKGKILHEFGLFARDLLQGVQNPPWGIIRTIGIDDDADGGALHLSNRSAIGKKSL